MAGCEGALLAANTKRSYPMKEHGDFLTILMADDNQDDCLVDFKR
jgi:hypothetical protein